MRHVNARRGLKSLSQYVAALVSVGSFNSVIPSCFYGICNARKDLRTLSAASPVLWSALATLRPVVPNPLLSYLTVVLGVFNVAVRTSHTPTN
jgi:hypothetical protein